MRIEPDKRVVLAILAVATVILFLLATGLTGLRLSPGLLMNFARPTQTSNTLGELPSAEGLIDFFRIGVALALVLFPFYLIYMLINPQRRKRLLRDVFVFGMLLFFFDRLRAIADNMTPAEGEVINPGGGELAYAAPAIEPLESFVNSPPAWITTTVGIGVATLTAAAIFGLLWFIFHRRQREYDPVILVAREAQEALDAIQAGGDLRDTIIQCYRRMMHAVRESRGIHRDVAVTPREFIAILTNRGIPDAPVQNLTRLFEDARYGHIEGGMRQQLEAVSALEEIVEAVRRQGEPA